MSSSLLHLNLSDVVKLLHEKKVSSVELVQASLDAIEREKDLNAFVSLNPEQALQAARVFDNQRSQGQLSNSLLGGVPVGLKDIFLVKGVKTTCCSKILSNFVAPYTATSAQKLFDAGGISVGQLNMDEFAMGSSNENSCYGPAKNPWDKARTPGGSSGGSAAAVAAGLVYGTLGTDTGGSIREPGSFCGLVSMKPSYGRVSRYGVIAFASSLDQVGAFGRSVQDCALMMQAICGHDNYDSTSVDTPVPNFSSHLEEGVKGLKIGIPREYFIDGLSSDVEKAIQEVIRTYERQGAQIVPVSLPHTDYAIAAYYVIATAEASSNLARYDGVRYGFSRSREKGLVPMYEDTREAGFGPEVKRRIILGTYVLSAGYYDAYYVKAQKVRTLLCQDFKHAFSQCDVILTPTTPMTAFKIGEKIKDPIQMYLTDVFTVSCNLAGIPGLSVPCGFDSQQLPIGMQLLGRAFDEATLLRVARAYERDTQWHQQYAWNKKQI